MRCTGFDASLLASINALENYISYYNLPKKGATSTGIVFAIYQVSLRFLDSNAIKPSAADI